MSRCNKCNVEILDQTDRCPLCHHVLKTNGIQGENTYPNARVEGKKYRKLENVVLYISIVVWGICISINFARFNTHGAELWWSITAGCILLYVNVLLRLTVLGRADHLFKAVSTVLLGLACLIQADVFTGYHGWALNFAYPLAILLIDIAILVLMFVFKRIWQTYIMAQIGCVLLALVGLFLYLGGMIQFPYPLAVAGAFSLAVFLGTIIIGDRRARDELVRRFHL